MNRWKIAFFTVLPLSVVAIVFVGYLFIDMAYTVTYMRDSYERTESKLEKLSEVFPKAVYAKKDIVHLLRVKNKGAFIVETSCSVQIDGLRFEFDQQGKMVRVDPNADTGPELHCEEG